MGLYNVKVVHAKEKIMTSKNITEAVTQKQSNGKIPQKYGAHPLKTPTPTCKSGESQEAITLNNTGLHRRSPRNPPHISRALP